MAISSGYSAEDLARLGPDALTRRRMLAEALLAKSAGQRKIEHPLQGAAQMAEALINGLRVRKLDNAETAGMKSGESAWSSLFGGSNASAPSAAMPAETGAGQELAATSPAPVDISGDKETFVSSLLPAAMEESKRTGVDPRIIVAQAVQETGWGKSAPGNNYFGIKSHGQSGGQTLATNEVVDGKTVRVNDSFRQFASPQDSVKGYGDFILQNPRYKPFREAQGLDAQLEALQASGYATDPNYSRSVGAIARGIKLPGEVAAASPQASMAAAAPASGYVDPMVSAANTQPQQMAAIPPSGGMPPLEPPRTIGTPPVPPNAPPPQQLAQALTGNAPPPQQQGPSVQDLAKILSNPWVSDEKKKIAQVLLGEKMKENDPLRKMQLEKGQLEIDQMKNPRVSPADQRRLEIEQQKLDFDRNGISAADKAKMDFDREKFEAEKAKGQWQKLTDGRLYNETTGEFKDAPPPAPGSVPPKFDDISSVRKEIQQLPAYKNMSQAAPIYKAMVETAGRNTRASDLNLVYGLGKIMDPTSVVREGEMVMVKNTASLPDWLVGAANALNGGAALQPETRKAIMTEAFGRMKGYSDEFEKNTGQYKGIAQRFNINPDDVIPPFEQFQPWDGVADTTSPASPSSAPADGMKKTTTGIPWRPIQ